MATFACTLVSFSFVYSNRTYMINVSVLCDTRNFGNLQQILKINIHIFEQIISPFLINVTNNNTKYIIFEMTWTFRIIARNELSTKKKKVFHKCKYLFLYQPRLALVLGIFSFRSDRFLNVKVPRGFFTK